MVCDMLSCSHFLRSQFHEILMNMIMYWKLVTRFFSWEVPFVSVFQLCRSLTYYKRQMCWGNSLNVSVYVCMSKCVFGLLLKVSKHNTSNQTFHISLSVSLSSLYSHMSHGKDCRMKTRSTCDMMSYASCVFSSCYI